MDIFRMKTAKGLFLGALLGLLGLLACGATRAAVDPDALAQTAAKEVQKVQEWAAKAAAEQATEDALLKQANAKVIAVAATGDPKALRTVQCSALHTKAQSDKIAPSVNTLSENATCAAQVLATALLQDSKADAKAYQGNLSHAAELVHSLYLESSTTFEDMFETDGTTVKTAAMLDDCKDVEGKGRARNLNAEDAIALRLSPALGSNVGSAGAGISQGTQGGMATISVPLHLLADSNWQQIVSVGTPTSKSTTTVSPTQRGLPNATSLKLNLQYASKNTDNPDLVSWLAGLSAEGGFQDHSYYESRSATRLTTTTEHPKAVGAYLGVVGLPLGDPIYNNHFWLLGYEYQDQQTDQKTQSYCTSLTAPCITGSIGLPKTAASRVWSGTYRYSRDSKYALAFTYSYDSVSHVHGYDLPVYLVPAPDPSNKSPSADSTTAPTRFNGGVDFSYRTDTHFGIGIFAGSTFDMFGGGD